MDKALKDWLVGLLDEKTSARMRDAAKLAEGLRKARDDRTTPQYQTIKVGKVVRRRHSWHLGKHEKLLAFECEGVLGRDLLKSHNVTASLTCVAVNGIGLGANGKPFAMDVGSVLKTDPENELSLCLLLELGKFRLFLGADLGGSSEEPSLVEEQLLKVLAPSAGLKASHHGSEGGTSARFLKSLSPEYVVISAGHHVFNHPRQLVLDNLEGCESVQQVYLTNCPFERTQIADPGVNQLGTFRVAGDAAHLGSIIVRVSSQDQSKGFAVTYWDAEQDLVVMAHESGKKGNATRANPTVSPSPTDPSVKSCPVRSSSLDAVTVALQAMSKDRNLLAWKRTLGGDGEEDDPNATYYVRKSKPPKKEGDSQSKKKKKVTKSEQASTFDAPEDELVDPIVTDPLGSSQGEEGDPIVLDPGDIVSTDDETDDPEDSDYVTGKRKR